MKKCGHASKKIRTTCPHFMSDNNSGTCRIIGMPADGALLIFAGDDYQAKEENLYQLIIEGAG